MEQDLNASAVCRRPVGVIIGPQRVLLDNERLTVRVERFCHTVETRQGLVGIKHRHQSIHVLLRGIARMPSSPQPPSEDVPDPAAGRVGGLLVMGLLLLGLTAASVAIVFQRGQTEQCLAFYGPAAAAAVARAGHVELWRLADVDGRMTACSRQNISQAKGLVHLRRGLVEDANFDWEATAHAEGLLPVACWDWAIVFADSPEAAAQGKATRLLVDLGGTATEPASAGWVTVVGQGGRVGLGRIGPGLADWIEATVGP